MTALSELKALQRTAKSLLADYNTALESSITRWADGFYRGKAQSTEFYCDNMERLIKTFEDEQLEATADKESS